MNIDQDSNLQSNTGKPKLYYGYIIVLISFLVLVIHAGQRNSFGVFLKPILDELQSSRGLISSVFSFSVLVNAIVAIPVGRLVDRFGPRPIITAGGLLIGIGYLLMTQTTAVWQMYLVYGVLVGAGSTLYVPVVSTVVRWFDARRNTMLGITAVGNSIGVIVMPVFASWLISVQSWRISFAVLGGIIMIVLVTISQFIRKNPDEAEQRLYESGKKNKTALPSRKNDFTMGSALRSPNLWLFLLMYLILGISCFTFTIHIVPYATDLGISATTAASLLSIMGAVGIGGRLIFGWMGDRYGVSLVILIGFALRMVVMILVVFSRDLMMLYLVSVLFGFSWGANIQGTSWLAHVFGTTSIASIMGVCTIGYMLGCAVGPYMAGYIYDSTGSYRWAFLMLAAIILVGIIIARLLPQVKVERRPAGN